MAARTDVMEHFGVGILRLASDVTAAIVAVDPGSVLMGIVHADQLAQRVIGVGGGQVSALLGDNVSAGIVLVLEGNAVLGDLLHQRRGAVRAEAAVDVGIAAGQLPCRCAAFRGSGCDATQLIVAVGYLLSIAVIGQLIWAFDAHGKARALSRRLKSGRQLLAADREIFIFFLCPLDGVQFKAGRGIILGSE